MTAAELHPWSWAETRPDAPALIMTDTGAVLTYKAMMDGANRCARLFDRLGLVTGDRVALLMENQLQYPQVCWAIENSGLYAVLISTQLNASDAAYIIENSGAKLLVASRAQAATAMELAKGMGTAKGLFMCDGAVAPFQSLEEAASQESALPRKGRPRGEILLYSSGTTGRPKGILRPLSEEGPELPVAVRHKVWTDEYGLGPDSVVLIAGPLYHSLPIRVLQEAHREGATVLSNLKFDPLTTLKAISKHGVTIAILVPTMLSRLLRIPADVRASVDVSSLRCIFHTAAPCPVPVKQAIIDWFGPLVYEMYGGSEGVGNTIINSREWLEHKGSVGRPARGTEVHVLDEHGNECPPLVNGTVYLTNGRPFEYLNDLAKTAESTNSRGWVSLGDVGYLDSDGFLYLTDRKSNMIISGGVNIYPQETENVLSGHPGVADVAVIGVPNDDLGEEVKAIVVPNKPIAAGSLAEFKADLLAYCAENLSRYKCPRSIEIVDDLPRNDVGKIQKRELLKRYSDAKTR
jgi:long-chain acyl-CoA synthetase